MNNLSKVSETAILTLRSRVVESRKNHPVISDPVGVELLRRIEKQAPEGSIKSLLHRKLPGTLTNPLALRARKYDSFAINFIKSQPDGIIVNLGAGFDTRYWRMNNERIKYFEVDLPEVIEAKKTLIGDLINYEMLSTSVLEDDWIEHIASLQTSNILLMAEGLFMYLPENEVIRTFTKISETFSNSKIIFEVVNKKYTQGFRKRMVEQKMKRRMGCSAGSSYNYGVQNAREIENYGNGIKVVEEWSYFDDKDIKPSFLRLFCNVRFMSRTQWTIVADLD
ncbi:MAG: class I SAM-dependent methyltransferase [Bacteroidales bacterium]|nr:class I SAM-dependent methyltransferase [Bacteroidales bacterium]